MKLTEFPSPPQIEKADQKAEIIQKTASDPLDQLDPDDKAEILAIQNAENPEKKAELQQAFEQKLAQKADSLTKEYQQLRREIWKTKWKLLEEDSDIDDEKDVQALYTQILIS